MIKTNKAINQNKKVTQKTNILKLKSTTSLTLMSMTKVLAYWLLHNKKIRTLGIKQTQLRSQIYTIMSSIQRIMRRTVWNKLEILLWIDCQFLTLSHQRRAREIGKDRFSQWSLNKKYQWGCPINLMWLHINHNNQILKMHAVQGHLKTINKNN